MKVIILSSLDKWVVYGFRNETIRYLIVGFSTVFVCWGPLLIMVEFFNIHYMIASNVAALVAYIYNYYLNKHFVFSNHTKTNVKHGTKFIILHIFLWLLSNAILFYTVELLKLHYFTVIIARATFLAILKYILMKLVFQP